MKQFENVERIINLYENKVALIKKGHRDEESPEIITAYNKRDFDLPVTIERKPSDSCLIEEEYFVPVDVIKKLKEMAEDCNTCFLAPYDIARAVSDFCKVAVLEDAVIKHIDDEIVLCFSEAIMFDE